MDNLPIQRDGHGLGSINDPINISLGNFPALDGDDPGTIEPLDVTPGNAGIDRTDFTASH
jgi:hypothetical protein